MRFRSDPKKAAANLREHGIPFSDAEGVFEDPLGVTIEGPDAQDERRFVPIGLGSASELLVVIWTERDDGYRVISARRPTLKERKVYES